MPLAGGLYALVRRKRNGVYVENSSSSSKMPNAGRVLNVATLNTYINQNSKGIQLARIGGSNDAVDGLSDARH